MQSDGLGLLALRKIEQEVDFDDDEDSILIVD